jgi:leucyl aminopeptidase
MKKKYNFIDLWDLETEKIEKKNLHKSLIKGYELRTEQLKYKYNKSSNNKTTINKFRDFANEPANKINPECFVKKVKKIFEKEKKVKIIVKDINQLKKENLNLIVSVDKNNAKMLICEYLIDNIKPIILVGKGVTYDTGGYSIKDLENMSGMHLDKIGGCMCLYILEKIIKEKIKKSIVVCIPLVENTISNNSTKPGDIIQSYSKINVEILDTDAEGRLIIADCLSYCSDKYKFKYIIDMGTFTFIRNCYISYTYFTLNNLLKNKIEKEAKKFSEKITRQEVILEYLELTKSKKSDIANAVNTCKYNDELLISYFLLNFIKKKYYKKWLHINLPMHTITKDYAILEGSESIYNFVKSL